MDGILSIYKPQGMTPFQLIEKLRELKTEYKDIKIGFAGRLDPLAHGVMLLTVGEENKLRQKYLSLNKTYRFSVLFGPETDSYDYLGVLQSFKNIKLSQEMKEKLKRFIKGHIGKINQTYPPFSSKTLNGIPLYKLAKKKKIQENELPKREVEIFRFELLGIKQIDSGEIEKDILKNLKKIRGYFRQGKIIKLWKELFKENSGSKFILADFEIDCSSGTYVRSLSHNMGLTLGTGAIAFEIFRTKVGDFSLDKALKIV